MLVVSGDSAKEEEVRARVIRWRSSGSVGYSGFVAK